jgi:hypothetical protein
VAGGLEFDDLARKVGAQQATALSQLQQKTTDTGNTQYNTALAQYQAAQAKYQAGKGPMPGASPTPPPDPSKAQLPGGMNYSSLARKVGDVAASKALIGQQALGSGVVLDTPQEAPDLGSPGPEAPPAPALGPRSAPLAVLPGAAPMGINPYLTEPGAEDQPLAGYAQGGTVRDTIPAMLQPNEYVLPPQTTAAFGVPALDAAVRATTGQEPGPTPVRAPGPSSAQRYARGGVVYGPTTPLGPLDDYVNRSRQLAVYGQSGGATPQVSDAEMAARPAPNTRFDPGNAQANMPRALPAGGGAARGGVETAGLMPFAGSNLPDRFNAVTDTGVPVDPAGRMLVDPRTVRGGYAGEPAGSGRGPGASLRELRMDAAVPQVRQEVAATIAASPAAAPPKHWYTPVEGNPLKGALPPVGGFYGHASPRSVFTGEQIPVQDAGPGAGPAAPAADSPSFLANVGRAARLVADTKNRAVEGVKGAVGSAVEGVGGAVSKGAHQVRLGYGDPEAIAAENRPLMAPMRQGAPPRSALMSPVGQQSALERPEGVAVAVDPRTASLSPVGAPAVSGQSLPLRADGPGGPVAFDANVPVTAADLGRQQAGAVRATLEGLRPGMTELPGGLSVFRPTTPEDEARYGKAILSDRPVLASPGGFEASKSSPNNLGPNLSPQGAQAEGALALARQWTGMTPKQRGRLPDRMADAMGVSRETPQAAPSLEALRLQQDAAKFALGERSAREEKQKDRALQADLKKVDVFTGAEKAQREQASAWNKDFQEGLKGYESQAAELGGAARPPLSAGARSFVDSQMGALRGLGVDPNAALGVLMPLTAEIKSDEEYLALATKSQKPLFGGPDPEAVAKEAALLKQRAIERSTQRLQAALAPPAAGR